MRASTIAAALSAAPLLVTAQVADVPDLTGVWVYRLATPLQRPEELKGKPLLSDPEVEELRARARRLFGDANSDAPVGDQLYLAVLADVETYRNVNATQNVGLDASVVDRDFENRTALITDPSDGRIPALTAEGRRRQAANSARTFTLPSRLGVEVPLEELTTAELDLPTPAGPQDLANATRCITWGVPRLGGSAFFTNHYQIFQSKDQLVLLQEVNHDARIISLDGRPALSERIRQWNGSSRGRWEGRTLVVETANFAPGGYFLGSAESLQLVERFSLKDRDTLSYEVTITDPTTWTQPWTVQLSFRRSDDSLYEFACHEGSYETIRGILGAARARDRVQRR